MNVKGIRILHIEDEDVDHMAVVRMIKSQGLPYDLDRASTISEATAKIERNSYDLVLLDYNLPDGTGLDLLEKIKETPAIFLTGSGDASIAVKAMKGGAHDYLIKDPYTGFLDLLPVTIEKAIYNFRLAQDHKRFEERIISQNAELGKLNQELQRLYEETRELSLHDPQVLPTSGIWPLN